MSQLGLHRPILNGRVNFPVCLAPMVGLSHIGLRLLVRRYLPQGARTIWPTEMLNSRRLPNEKIGHTPETYRHGLEEGLVPQILGNEPDPIKQSVQLLAQWGAEAIDINMGCSVNKALRHNYGVALMGDAEYAAQVVQMTTQASRLPVSVKLRAGLQNDQQYLLRFVRGLENAGASWICLHPRLAEQKRRGRADWSQIQWLREKIQIPVIGNGDVQTVEDVIRMLESTQCDMVMIGRALTARPWLLWQLGHQLGWPNPQGQEGGPPTTPLEEGYEFIKAYQYLLSVMREYFPESLGVRKFQFMLRNSVSWLNFGHALWSRSTTAKTYNELATCLEEFSNVGLSMAAETELRQ